MDLTPYVNRLREDLTAAASAGDEQTRQTAGALGAALEPAARLAIMNALSDLAAEVTATLEDRVVELGQRRRGATPTGEGVGVEQQQGPHRPGTVRPGEVDSRDATRSDACGADADRTRYLFHAMEALYQLSYSPEGGVKVPPV